MPSITIGDAKPLPARQRQVSILIEKGLVPQDSGRWHDLLERPDVLIVDTETTGVDMNVDEVVDIAVIDTTGRTLLNELVMPTRDILLDASRMHGLTIDILKEQRARTWPEHHKRVKQLLQEATLVLAYNAEFDQRIITRTAQVHDLPAPENVRWRCLMLEYSEWLGEPDPHRLGESKWYSLEEAYRREVGGVIQEHRALADCRMSLELMQVLAVGRNGGPAVVSQEGIARRRRDAQAELDRQRREAIVSSVGEYKKSGWCVEEQGPYRALLVSSWTVDRGGSAVRERREVTVDNQGRVRARARPPR